MVVVGGGGVNECGDVSHLLYMYAVLMVTFEQIVKDPGLRPVSIYL